MKASCVLVLLFLLPHGAYSAVIGPDDDEQDEYLVSTRGHPSFAPTTMPAGVDMVTTPSEVTTSAFPWAAHTSKALPTLAVGVSVSSGTTAGTPSSSLYRKECGLHLMVAGGLIVLCFILLMSILLLTWRVCQLSRRLKALGSGEERVSNSGYWTGAAKGDKSKPAAEAKETSMLMADVGNGTAKEEGAAAEEDEAGGKAAAGGGGEEDAAATAEAATAEAAAEKKVDATPAEASSTPKQQEATADSQPTATSEAPVSEQPKESV